MRTRGTRALLLLLLALGLGVAAPQAKASVHGVTITAAVDSVTALPGRVERPGGTDPGAPHAVTHAALPTSLQLLAPTAGTPLLPPPTTPSYDGGPVSQGRGPPGA